MKTIWKYQLGAETVLDLPVGAKVLSAQVQSPTLAGEDIYLWALVESTAPTEERRFVVFGTGHEVKPPLGGDLEFIDTVQMQGGSLVFHVFENVSIKL